MITRDALSKALVAIFETDCVRATKYLSQKQIVRATRRRYKRGGKDKRYTEVLVTAGRPNYAERQFIKKHLKAGKTFPIKGLVLKFGK